MIKKPSTTTITCSGLLILPSFNMNTPPHRKHKHETKPGNPKVTVESLADIFSRGPVTSLPSRPQEALFLLETHFQCPNPWEVNLCFVELAFSFFRSFALASLKVSQHHAFASWFVSNFNPLTSGPFLSETYEQLCSPVTPLGMVSTKTIT